MSDEEQTHSEASEERPDDERRTDPPLGVLDDPENIAGKYRPQDATEQRRSWLVEETLVRYSHLGPAEFVQLLKWIDEWMTTGAAPSKSELEKEKKLRPVPQMRSV